MDKPTQISRANAFRALHDGPDILFLPNNWDVTSAKLLAGAGFPAVATTSAGVCYVFGYPVGERIPRDLMLDMVRRSADAVDIPVSADMESGFGDTPEAVRETARLTVEAGAVGMNIEDGAYSRETPLRPFDDAVARIAAAAAGIAETGIPAVLNARTDTYWTGGKNADETTFAETIRRAEAFLEAGATTIFVPGVRNADLIGRLTKEIPAPLNIMADPKVPSLSELQDLGVRRVTVGAWFARAAYSHMHRVADGVRDGGLYDFMNDVMPHAEMNRILSGK